MEYRVLGPLEVLDSSGQSVSLGGAIQQSVLASLLLRAGQTVARDRLIDDLWEEPPATAPRTLQTYVSRLRHELPDGAIETRPGGYRFVVDVGQLDLQIFETLVGEGHTALGDGDCSHALGLLERALALWRGPALSGLSSTALSREAERLEERRLAALEDRTEAALGCARYAELVPELTLLVAEHPLRERLRAQYMRALYGAGRPGDALAVYREGRNNLVRELGMEPSQELRDLEQAILRQDAALDGQGKRRLPDQIFDESVTRQGAAEAALGRNGHSQGVVDAPATSVVEGEGDFTWDVELEPETRAAGRRRLGTRVVLGACGVAVAAAAAVVAGVLLVTRAGSNVAVAANSVAVIDPKNDKVVADVQQVGTKPTQILSGANGIWISSAEDGTITKIDPKSRRVIKTLGLGFSPSYMAAGNGSVWVTSGGSGTVVPIDARYVLRGSPIALPHIAEAGGSPSADGVAVASGSVWVYDSGQLTVFRINPITAEVDRRHLPPATVGNTSPTPIAVRRGVLWYLCCWNREIKGRFIDNTEVQRVDLRSGALLPTDIGGGFPTALALDGNALWVTQYPESLIRIEPFGGSIDLKTPLGHESNPVALAVGDHAVWVADANADSVARVDPRPNGRVTAIQVGGHSPTGIAVANGLVWVAVAS